MNIKTYFDKTNTIIYNSEYNTSQNPVCELYYGDGYTRILLEINTDKIKSMIEDKTFSNTSKLKHLLKMKNCWGLQSISSNFVFNSGKYNRKERTSSFDLHLVRMPESWDSGIGNDFTKDGFITNNSLMSKNGSNWFNSASQLKWVNGSGVFTGITYGDSNIIATQHFQIGNEDIEIDITNEINSIISGTTPNNGFMLCFDSSLEQTNTNIAQYIGFFTNKTTTFFKPYLETIYSETITDDRNEFYLNKDNKLYLYSIIGGQHTNLDQIPTCTIEGVQYAVKQAEKGVYYVDINLPSELYQSNIILYDVWSNIVYNNKMLPNIELEFVTKESTEYFNLGNESYEQEKYVPTVYGIKNGENVNMGQILKIFVSPRIEYTTNNVRHITGMEYRLYVKETDKEITVIDYDQINRSCNSNYFILHTENLLPNKYYVDIKIKRYDQEIIHKEKLNFKIVNEL